MSGMTDQEAMNTIDAYLPRHCRAALDHIAARLRGDGEQYPEAAEVCGEAYQVVGSLLDDLGVFNTPQAEKVLDNLSQHRMVHKDVLPWPSFAALSTQPAPSAPLPAHDASRPNTEQGLYRKFDVRRTDGTDAPGGKHDGCDYFVLDMTHDPFAPAAAAAYAIAAEAGYPRLAADMRIRYGLSAPSEQVAASVPCAFRSLLAEARRQYRDSDAAGDVLAWLDERVLDVDHAASVSVPEGAIDALYATGPGVTLIFRSGETAARYITKVTEAMQLQQNAAAPAATPVAPERGG